MSKFLDLLNKADKDDGDNNLIIDEQKSSDLPFGLDKVVDTVVDTAVGVKKAVTGEDKQIEFENAGEITDIDLSFFETLVPNLKMMVSRSDMGKAEIIKDTYEADDRFGGAFVDKFNNPLILWENKPYYINKPGATETDFSNVVSEILKFYPAAKFASTAKTKMGTAGKGIIGYGTTETANIAGEEFVSPETSKSKTVGDRASEVGVSTAIGVGADLLAPPVGKAVGAGLRAVTPKKFVSSLPTITKDVYETITKSKYPLTKGQATSKPFQKGQGDAQAQASKQIMEEDRLRFSKDDGGEIITGFDKEQLEMIRKDADTLTETMGSGQTTGVEKELVPLESATGIKNIVTKAAQGYKKSAQNLYENANLNELILTPQGINKFSEDAINSVKELNIGTTEMAMYPTLKKSVEILKRLNKISANPNFKQKPFSVMRDFQKTINRLIRNVESKAPGSPELLGMKAIKSTLDDYIVKGVDNAFIVGDETVIENLLKANKDYRSYIGLTGKDVGKDASEKAANNILKKLTNPGLDADAVVNTFFGHARFQPASVMNLVLKKIQQNIPKDQFKEVVALVKDGILTRGFSGAGKSGVTRTNIINNYNQTFKKNKQLINQLFSKEELTKIEQFKDNVLPTLWAELKMNPPNTANMLMFSLARKGLLSYAGKIPLVGEMLDPQSYRGISETRSAVDAISGYMKRKKAPLFSNLIQAPIRTEGSEPPSNIKEIIKDVGITRVPDTLLNKINQAVQ